MLTHHIFCLVFGAKQFHPILQADQIEQYYLMFYAAINVGALCALVVLILANYSMKAAYAIPVFGFILGFAVFLAFSKRYVRRPPEKAALFGTLGLIGKTAVDCKSFDASKKSNGGAVSDSFVDGVKRLLLFAPVSMLTLPFNIAYIQMNSDFIFQGNAMRIVAKVIDSSSFISNFDSIAVLVAGAVVSTFVYPALEKRDMRLSQSCHQDLHWNNVWCHVHSHGNYQRSHDSPRIPYLKDGSELSILCQMFNCGFIGIGEIRSLPLLLVTKPHSPSHTERAKGTCVRDPTHLFTGIVRIHTFALGLQVPSVLAFQKPTPPKPMSLAK